MTTQGFFIMASQISVHSTAQYKTECQDIASGLNLLGTLSLPLPISTAFFHSPGNTHRVNKTCRTG
jgi:hypothetical protein